VLVELGNPAPTATENAPVVTYCSVPGTYTYVVADSAEQLALEAAAHIGRSSDGVTRLPDQEALLAVIAGWRAESTGNPTWVWSDDGDFAVLLGHFFGCPVGRPDNLEATHFTTAGAPGVFPPAPAPEPAPEPEVIQ
jgi:hypothetical protein